MLYFRWLIVFDYIDSNFLSAHRHSFFFFFAIRLWTLDIRLPSWYTHYEGASLPMYLLRIAFSVSTARARFFFCQFLWLPTLTTSPPSAILRIEGAPLNYLNCFFPWCERAPFFFQFVRGTLDIPKSPWYTNHSPTNGHFHLFFWLKF